MWKAYIVDDEPLARDELKYLLQKSKQVEVLGEAGDFDAAVEEIGAMQPNMVFLDIHLSEKSGLDIAKALKALPVPPLLIFTTADDKYALTAFDLNAFDYIMKPIEETKLLKCLEKCRKLDKFVLEKNIRRVEKLAVPVDERIIVLDMRKIVYVSLSEKKSVIKTTDANYMTNDTLAAIEKKLPPELFLRVHRSFIANFHHIVEVEPWFNSTYNLTMSDKSKIPVSRTYVKDIKRRFGI